MLNHIDTAYVRNGYRDTWHYFDDTRFSVCEEAKVVVSRDGVRPCPRVR